jgi:thiamine pyrophosphate-dependent acetolactate synthase large subunit-like protein
MAGVAVAGAAGAVSAADVAKAAASPPAPAAVRPGAAVRAAETRGVPQIPDHAAGKPGSDFMVDVIKTLDIDYIATNPASSCRGIHESLINYGMNVKPEMLTVMHEESGAAMAHGYFKVTGKPMIGLYHGTVGLQHASMAIYNAWCDRVPMVVLVGNHLDAAERSPGVPTSHAALDPIMMVRDFTKWDDQPWSLQHFAESMVRAYKIAMTPPMEPVAISIDAGLQESPIAEGAELHIPEYTPTAPPQGDAGAVREAARLLANAENPVIVPDLCARSQEGMDLIVELAELLNAAVVDRRGRQNFPNMHYLASGGGVIGQADVILGLELSDFYGTVNRGEGILHRTFSPRIRPGTKLISIGTGDLYIRANFQDFQRMQPVDVSIGADAQTTLPALIEAVRSEIPASRRAAIEQRADVRRRAHAQARRAAREEAMFGWDASPISLPRLTAEIWQQIRDEDWATMGDNLEPWADEFWTFDKHHQYIGGSSGTGAGWGLPAAVGAALGHREFGRLPINIQNDGDCMYAPGALWTSAYHNIPMLSIMNNNRGYHQEVMHVQRVGLWRDRGADRAHIGTEITNPDIQYAMLARSMGVEGIGQITDPGELAGAIRRGIEVVKAGEPVLIDVLMQPR